MRNVSLLVSFFVLNFVYGQHYVSLENSTICKNKLAQNFKSTQTLSANFTESFYSSMFDKPKLSKGKFWFKKENKIRWQKYTGTKQIILINGNTLKVSENEKEISNPAANRIVKRIQSLMLKLLSGNFLNEKDFDVRYFESARNYKLVLIPKSSKIKGYINQIDLCFDKKTLFLKTMALKETEQEKMVYTFTKVVKNIKISDKLFNIL